MWNTLQIRLAVFFLGVIHWSLCSQVVLNPEARRFLTAYKQHESLFRSNDSEWSSRYNLISVPGKKGKYIGVSCLVNVDMFDSSFLDKWHIQNDTRLNDLWTFRVPVDKFEEFSQLSGLRYMEVSEKGDPFLARAIVDSRADSVNRGYLLPQAYTGKNVIIAVIDWGFDYTHPVFYDSTLTRLRISRAWDQNKLSGPPPSGFSFGTEYIGQEDLLRAGNDTLYHFGPISHGTHVAGIAGGNGAGTNHKGAAPDAELIFISLRRDASSFVDAIHYVSDYALSVQKPFVINMSFGGHLGPHDGSSLDNYAMDQMTGPGQIFVGSAGNNGFQQFHLDHDFNAESNDTLYTVVDFAGGADIFGQTVAIWGSENSEFRASFMVTDGANNILGETPFFSTQENLSMDTTVMVRNVNLRYILDTDFGSYLNNKPSMRWQIKNVPPNLKVVLKVTSEDSHVHMWNCQRHNDRYTNWGRPFKDNFPGAKAGDELFGVGEPAGTGKNVVTVASYQPEILSSGGIPLRGGLSSFTSSGPTVDGRIKPDIASTGQEIVSAVSSFDPTYGTNNYVARVNFEDKTYGFVAFSGTSMSSPMVAGITALMLEADPGLRSSDIKRILSETSRLDSNTGSLPDDGHLKWGHGKANALAALQAVLAISGEKYLTLNNQLTSLYPNPTSDQVTIRLIEGAGYLKKIVIYDLEGKAVLTHPVLWDTDTEIIDVGHLTKGLYLLECITPGFVGYQKLVVNP